MFTEFHKVSTIAATNLSMKNSGRKINQIDDRRKQGSGKDGLGKSLEGRSMHRQR